MTFFDETSKLWYRLPKGFSIPEADALNLPAGILTTLESDRAIMVKWLQRLREKFNIDDVPTVEAFYIFPNEKAGAPKEGGKVASGAQGTQGGGGDGDDSDSASKFGDTWGGIHFPQTDSDSDEEREEEEGGDDDDDRKGNKDDREEEVEQGENGYEEGKDEDEDSENDNEEGDGDGDDEDEGEDEEGENYNGDGEGEGEEDDRDADGPRSGRWSDDDEQEGMDLDLDEWDLNLLDNPYTCGRDVFIDEVFDEIIGANDLHRGSEEGGYEDGMDVDMEEVRGKAYRKVDDRDDDELSFEDPVSSASGSSYGNAQRLKRKKANRRSMSLSEDDSSDSRQDPLSPEHLRKKLKSTHVALGGSHPAKGKESKAKSSANPATKGDANAKLDGDDADEAKAPGRSNRWDVSAEQYARVKDGLDIIQGVMDETHAPFHHLLKKFPQYCLKFPQARDHSFQTYERIYRLDHPRGSRESLSGFASCFLTPSSAPFGPEFSKSAAAEYNEIYRVKPESEKRDLLREWNSRLAAVDTKGKRSASSADAENKALSKFMGEVITGVDDMVRLSWSSITCVTC